MVDDVDGAILSLPRDQERIVSAQYTTPQGDFTVEVDERLRPVRIVSSTTEVTLTWGEGNDVDLVVDDLINGTQATLSTSVDLSDDALIAAFNAQETATGRDLSAARQWINDHPGLAAQRALGTTGFAAPPTDFRVDVKELTTVTSASFQIGAVLIGVAGYLAAVTGGAGLAAICAGAAAVFGAIVIAAVLFDVLWALLFDNACCTPCGLGCFFTCCWD